MLHPRQLADDEQYDHDEDRDPGDLDPAWRAGWRGRVRLRCGVLRCVFEAGRGRHLIGDLIAEGATSGELRDDVAPDELAGYCLHALTAAADLASRAAVLRLVGVTLSGLRAR